MKNKEGAKQPKRVLDISSGSVENLPVHTPRKAEKLSLSAKADLPQEKTELPWREGICKGCGKKYRTQGWCLCGDCL